MQPKRNRSATIMLYVLSFMMIASLFTGFISNWAQQRAAQREIEAAQRPTPVPTFLPPLDPVTISYSRRVLQGNGLFSILVPEPPDWVEISSTYEDPFRRGRIFMRDDQHVIDAFVEEPTAPITDLEGLSQFFNSGTLNVSWRSYSAWKETNRILDTEQNLLVIDFEVTANNRTFVSRQISWLSEPYVNTVRVITPDNATDLLINMLDNLVPSLVTYTDLAQIPTSWKVYYDETHQHLIRYPSTWNVTDSADGAPATIEGEDAILRVERVEGAFADEADFTAYVETLPYFSSIQSVQNPEYPDGVAATSVTYLTQDADGNVGSGNALFVNYAEGWHLANLVMPNVEIDLHTELAEPASDAPQADQDRYTQYSTWNRLLDTFSYLADVDLAAPSSGVGNTPIIEATPTA